MVLLAEGFGFNTNILETNVLNLAVVVPAVFVLGKDTLKSILETRREKILASLRSADDRFKAAQLELDAAKSELALAKDKVAEIQAEGRQTISALKLEEESALRKFQYVSLHLKKRQFVLKKKKLLPSSVNNSLKLRLKKHSLVLNHV